MVSEKVTAIGFVQALAVSEIPASAADAMFQSLLDLQAHGALTVVRVGVAEDGTCSAIWKERTVDGWKRAIALQMLHQAMHAFDSDEEEDADG